MVGANLAGRAAGWFSGTTLLLLFAAMMLATSLNMLLGKRAPESEASRPHQPAWRIALQGLVVGSATGLVGAGGGFLIVPALVLLGGLPMTDAIGTSLLPITMQSLAGYLGHASHVAIDVPMAAAITGAAIAGSFGGTKLACYLPSATLRRSFGAFVLVMAVLVGVREAPASVHAALATVPVGGWIAIAAGIASAAALFAWSASRRALRESRAT